jgi:ABC-type multidrug transport system fused ATPase/permease subunit
MTVAGTLNKDEDQGDRKFRKYKDRVLLGRLISYMLVYKKNLAIVVGSLVFAAIVGVVGPYLLAIVALNDIFNRRFFGLDGALAAVGAYVALYLVSYLSDNKRTYHMQIMGQNIIQDLRRDSFAKLQDLSPSYFSSRETGRIMSYITNDVDALSDFVTFQLPQVLAGAILIVSIVPTMLHFNFGLTLVSLTVIPPLVIITLAFQGRIQTSFVETRKKIAIVTSKLQEGIAGVKVTQSFTEEQRVSRDFDLVNQDNLETNLHANKLTSIFSALIQLIEAGGIALVIWYGTAEVIKGQITPEVVVAFLLYMNSFFSPIIQLTTFYNSYQSAVTGLDRVVQVMDTSVDVPPPSRESKVSLEKGKEEYSRKAIEIEFDNVTFGYSKDIPVIKNLNLKIKPEEVVAIVGHTGAGKSSLVNLILRFYDPQEGRVLLNGIDLRKLDFNEFRERLSLVPQDPFLFQATVFENIRYGNESASDLDIIELCKHLGIHDFINRLPHGYNTLVSESATNLSMGQKQMICFARAIIRDPKLLILDEATSGLDPVAELQLQRALTVALKGRTAIIIAHRLSTIRMADRIIVMRDGQIAEQGTFIELNSLHDGLFSKMYSMQFQTAPQSN